MSQTGKTKARKKRKVIKDWQVHTLTFTKEHLDTLYPGKKAIPMIVTGTVVKDPTGKLKVGNHMKTSLVVKLDREKKRLETLNTIYKLEGEEGKDVLPNLGNNVLNIFY